MTDEALEEMDRQRLVSLLEVTLEQHAVLKRERDEANEALLIAKVAGISAAEAAGAQLEELKAILSPRPGETIGGAARRVVAAHEVIAEVVRERDTLRDKLSKRDKAFDRVIRERDEACDALLARTVERDGADTREELLTAALARVTAERDGAVTLREGAVATQQMAGIALGKNASESLLEAVERVVCERDVAREALFRERDKARLIKAHSVAVLTENRLLVDRDAARTREAAKRDEVCTGEASCVSESNDPDEYCLACRAAYAIDEAGRLERERDAALAQMSTMIRDTSLPEHLQANARQVLDLILATARERDAVVVERDDARKALDLERRGREIERSDWDAECRRLNAAVMKSEAVQASLRAAVRGIADKAGTHTVGVPHSSYGYGGICDDARAALVAAGDLAALAEVNDRLVRLANQKNKKNNAIMTFRSSLRPVLHLQANGARDEDAPKDQP